jgi:predicted AlkP superfamily pyrophosphatase or phosphodiesterase
VINELSLQAIEASKFSKSFVKPLYESFCFSRIPASINSLLTEGKGGLPLSCFEGFEQRYDTVILFFLDAFGWRFFEKYIDHPFLQRFVQQGVVSKITSQFPSTTAAEVTTIHTGLEVGQSGIYEWFQYEPRLNRIIAPLPFCYAGDMTYGALNASKIPAEEFFPFKTVYQKWHEEGVFSYILHHETLCPTTYSQSLGKGAHFLSYFSLTQGLRSVEEFIQNSSKGKSYLLFYYSDIDSIGHRKGPGSQELELEILQVLDLLEEHLQKLSVKKQQKIAVLVTADHGMEEVDPKKTIYLNKEIASLSSLLKLGADQKPLTPAGSCRDFFLHVLEGREEETLCLLTTLLKDRAEVWKTSELIKRGFFGSKAPSSRFLERVGNVVVLPYSGESVWWYEKGRFEQHFYGAHGGLSHQEVEVPFLFLPM